LKYADGEILKKSFVYIDLQEGPTRNNPNDIGLRGFVFMELLLIIGVFASIWALLDFIFNPK
jgi:hypothetical protein